MPPRILTTGGSRIILSSFAHASHNPDLVRLKGRLSRGPIAAFPLRLSSLEAVPIVPGSVIYTNPGTYTFIAPAYNALTVTLWGAGGQGAYYLFGYLYGSDGTASTFNSGSLSAGGGKKGTSSNGLGGVASGGDVNTNGGNATNINGGNCPNGGNGGVNAAGVFPGGGGAGVNNGGNPFGGGGGAYTQKTYSKGVLTRGASYDVVVGICPTGIGAGFFGANGKVMISWS